MSWKMGNRGDTYVRSGCAECSLDYLKLRDCGVCLDYQID